MQNESPQRSISSARSQRRKDSNDQRQASTHDSAAAAPEGSGSGQIDGPLTPAIAGVLNSWVSDAETVARHSKDGGDEPKAESVSQFAEFGMNGRRSQLPYQNEMERGFGQSLGDIPVYSGSKAHQASEALNAEAYTFQGSIVLGENASKHTVAEETAHALQYRSGSLPSGGGLLDPMSGPELEAGSAADAIVAGQSAPSMSHGLGSSAVARKKKKGNKKKKSKSKNKKAQDKLKKSKEKNKMPKGSGSVGRDRLVNDKRMGGKDLGNMQDSHRKQSADLTKGERDSHAKGQALIYDQNITKGKTVEQAGNKGAHQLSKVLPSPGDMLAGTHGYSTGGSIGHAETTSGRSAKATKEILGLDYSGSSFLNDKDDPSSGFKDEGVTYIQFGMTKEMKEQARLSVDPEQLKHIHDMQAKSGPLKSELNNMKMLDYANADDGGAFKGHGGTATSGAYGDSTTTVNQELTFGKGEKRGGGWANGDQTYLPLPDGTMMMHRDKAGEDKKIAELQTNDDGVQEWEYNMGLIKQDPGLLLSNMQAELDTLTDNLEAANESVSKGTKAVGDINKNIGKKEKEVNGLKSKVSSTEKQLNSAKSSGSDTTKLNSQLTTVKASLSKAQSALDKLKDSKAKEDDTLTKAKDKQASVQAKMDSRKPILDSGIKKATVAAKKKAK